MLLDRSNEVVAARRMKATLAPDNRAQCQLIKPNSGDQKGRGQPLQPSTEASLRLWLRWQVRRLRIVWIGHFGGIDHAVIEL